MRERNESIYSDRICEAGFSVGGVVEFNRTGWAECTQCGIKTTISNARNRQEALNYAMDSVMNKCPKKPLRLLTS